MMQACQIYLFVISQTNLFNNSSSKNKGNLNCESGLKI